MPAKSTAAVLAGDVPAVSWLGGGNPLASALHRVGVGTPLGSGRSRGIVASIAAGRGAPRDL